MDCHIDSDSQIYRLASHFPQPSLAYPRSYLLFNSLLLPTSQVQQLQYQVRQLLYRYIDTQSHRSDPQTLKHTRDSQIQLVKPSHFVDPTKIFSNQFSIHRQVQYYRYRGTSTSLRRSYVASTVSRTIVLAMVLPSYTQYCLDPFSVRSTSFVLLSVTIAHTRRTQTMVGVIRTQMSYSDHNFQIRDEAIHGGQLTLGKSTLQLTSFLYYLAPVASTICIRHPVPHYKYSRMSYRSIGSRTYMSYPP